MTPLSRRTAFCLLMATTCPLLACSSEEAAALPTEQEPDVGTVESFAEIGTPNEGLVFSSDARGQPTLTVGSADALQRVASDGTVTHLVDLPGPLGMAMRADGNLLVCGRVEPAMAPEGSRGALWLVTPDGQKSLFVGPDRGPFGIANFVVVDRDGSAVFSDSAENKVHHVSADGSTVRLVTDAVTYPNGMAFSPDGTTLYLASWDSSRVYGLARTPTGFGPPEVVVDTVVNADGVAVLSNGDLVLVSNGEGVVRVGLGGPSTVIAPATELKLPANGAFGLGAFGDKWLYVTNLMGLHVSRVYMGETGAPLPLR